ncbi:MAG TPA: peptidyl-prolyl cis-trans isomerase, partial [Polyangiaceae bacterium]|nr:peptidyl-prolyl cis-trans isomerase [Polyangiaceae bacterium]
PASLRVEVPAEASRTAIDHAVAQAMLLDVALRAGWARTDPVVRDRLVRNMRFAGAEGDDEAVLNEALRLDMARRDPVARQRLIESARALLIRRATPAPTEEELEAYRRDHPERFTRPGKLRVHQVFVSAERHGEQIATRAATVAQRLETLTPSESGDLSDPILLGIDLGWIDARRLDASLGPGTADALATAEIATWIGPVRTTFGLHYFWIDARRPSTLPPLDAIRPEVVQAWRKDAEARALAASLERLRTTYDVEVVR